MLNNPNGCYLGNKLSPEVRTVPPRIATPQDQQLIIYSYGLDMPSDYTETEKAIVKKAPQILAFSSQHD